MAGGRGRGRAPRPAADTQLTLELPAGTPRGDARRTRTCRRTCRRQVNNRGCAFRSTSARPKDLTVARTWQHDARALVSLNRSRRTAPGGAARARGSRALFAAAAAVVTSLGAFATTASLAAPAAFAQGATDSPTHPYAGGGVVPFGDAGTYGTLDVALSSVITGMAATPDGKGYWLVGADGGVFAFGDAPFVGSLGARKLEGPIVAMAPTPDGKGYWLAALDGGVFALGDATYYGSMGGTRLTQPVVGMAATPDGKGYWLVAADGGVFSFGDANYYGSMGDTHLAAAVTGMAATPDGKGYWMVGGDGGVFAFGDATYYGSMGSKPPPTPSPAWPPPPTARGTGWWRATGPCSSTATPRDSARPPPPSRSPRWRASSPPPTARATGSSSPTTGTTRSPTRRRTRSPPRPTITSVAARPGRPRPRQRGGPVLQPLRPVRAMVRALPHLGVGAGRHTGAVDTLHRQRLRVGGGPRPHPPGHHPARTRGCRPVRHGAPEHRHLGPYRRGRPGVARRCRGHGRRRRRACPGRAAGP